MLTLPTTHNYQQTPQQQEQQQEDETRQMFFINEALTSNEICIQPSIPHNQGNFALSYVKFSILFSIPYIFTNAFEHPTLM